MAAADQPKLNNAPIVVIQIQFSPASQQIQVAWPQVDDVMKLGMLEMAKVLLQEARISAGVAKSSGLIVPSRGPIVGGN